MQQDERDEIIVRMKAAISTLRRMIDDEKARQANDNLPPHARGEEDAGTRS